MPEAQTKLETHPFIVDASKMIELMAGFGWRTANAQEIPQMLALGERLVDGQLISPETLTRLHGLTGLTAWVFGDPIEGLVISVPLSPEGLDAVQENRFVAMSPDNAFVAAAGEPCAACYIGIYAGETKAARKAVMSGAGVIRMAVFAQVPCFARAATEDGARSMESLGWKPAGFGADKLWMQGALVAPETKVA
ncbi:MAG: hypothetical protein ACX94B_07885 [Henriciella sp.]|nr:hypothetical protein [Hyphomonadaceae bacterium]